MQNQNTYFSSKAIVNYRKAISFLAVLNYIAIFAPSCASNSGEYKGIIIDERLSPSRSRSSAASHSEENTKFLSNSIPGITPVDVYGNFEQKGFAVNKQIGANDALFICTSEEDGIDYEVKTYSEEELMGVTAVQFTALRTDPQYNSLSELKPFFKYGCSIPYDGADPEKVANFIDKNWKKDKATITISGVRFTIYCPTEFARIMEVEKAL